MWIVSPYKRVGYGLVVNIQSSYVMSLRTLMTRLIINAMLCYVKLWLKPWFMLGHVVFMTIHARRDTRDSRQVNDLSRKGPARHGGVRCSLARFIGYARGVYSGLLHSTIFRKINSDNHSYCIWIWIWICTTRYVYVYAMRLDMYSLDNRMLCILPTTILGFPNRPV